MKRNKKTYLIHKKFLDEIISFLTADFGLPEINSSLAMYAEYKDRIIEIKFINALCYLRSYDRTSSFDQKFMDIFNSTPPIKIENLNIKYFLRVINSLNFSKAYISDEVTQLNFNSTNKGVVNLSIGTPIGDLLVIDGIVDISQYEKKGYFISELKQKDIDKLFSKTSKEEIFSNDRILNDKIINYGNKFGIDLISSGEANIESKLSAKSNDYSFFENFYKKIVGKDLNIGRKENILNNRLFKPLSIVIPSYNSNETIIQVLCSIESQELPKHLKKEIDVVVIDDGSDTPVIDCLKSYSNKFSFKLNIIRFEYCKGLSSARNTGISSSIYNHILFIDSDILLSKNYLLEHSLALQIFPNGIFVSMKNNIDKNSSINNIKHILKGLESPKEYDDKRIFRDFEKDQKWINTVSFDGIVEALSDTRLFKDFGHSRVIDGYDLPSMVTGHNMSAGRKLITEINGFPSHFLGWGLEDTYFGARIICGGGFVIPLINTGVYHVNHPPRSGSKVNQDEEYAKNLEIYKELIKEPI